ncbi:hypothetical protein ATE84_1363 [Aquimarina sp. MAR_2010_214]|uniref:hypothetical protein n=1 Tax=Aquimarina sp. MAR_2010_214 TaxID=1250026 RepID=UPI000C70E8E0|nr:hypothetical protein [Aquimarina sp. MAR_2010_214]PKV49342.1 hypothetical protein ATE84_1363 [Aquimarina sp. MAR_2010_214]
MLKKILSLKDAQKIEKKDQKSISGGRVPVLIRCYPSSDPECCGTAQWQCGVGPHSGGLYRNGYCVCF